jgi:ribosome biogenesis protein ERB1
MIRKRRAREESQKEKEGRAWKKTSANRSNSKKSILLRQENDNDGAEEFNMNQRIIDPETGQSYELDEEEMHIIRRVLNNEYADEDFDPYQPFEEFFSGKDKMTAPLIKRTEPKNRSLPSRFEAKRIMRLARAIQKGRLILKDSEKDNSKFTVSYDVWEKNFDMPEYKRPEFIPAPRMNLPAHEESYNPPPEYLPTEQERANWESEEPTTRKPFLPTGFKAFRHVPSYARFIQERFARCLDLYMCARQRRNKLMIDPDSLLPKLPSAEELRPFPETKSTEYKNGHEGQSVTAIAVDASGKYLASVGGEFVVVWDITSGRARWQVKFENEKVKALAWRPGGDGEEAALAFSVGSLLYIATPFSTSHKIPISFESTSESSRKPSVEWKRNNSSSIPGLQVVLVHDAPVISVSWHRKGDYFVSVCTNSPTSPISLHQLSKGISQNPFRKLSSPLSATFSPVRPQLFVTFKSSSSAIKMYNLKDQKLEKKFSLGSGAIQTSNLALHTDGDNFVVGSGDGRVFWFDIDLSSDPYKALQPHSTKESVKNVSMHAKFPLFASVSSSNIQVFHGQVFSDLNMNALIVPVKKIPLEVSGQSLSFHPKQPWLFVGDQGGTITLYV